MMSHIICKRRLTTPERAKEININKFLVKQKLSSFIYVQFSNKYNKLKIIHEEEKNKIHLNSEYETIGRKLGTKREFKLLKLAINEFFNQNIIRNHEIKESLIKYLTQE